MANYLDLLLAVDQFTRENSAGYVQQGLQMHEIAQGSGLAPGADPAVARWTGELVDLDYLTHGPASAGDRRPIPPGAIWSDN